MINEQNKEQMNDSEGVPVSELLADDLTEGGVPALVTHGLPAV